jgi:hypothetical protein
MNDKGKGKVAAAASSSSPTVFDAFSPMPALSKKLEMLSGGKGKSKEQDEPLPGNFLPFSPVFNLTDFSTQSIPNLTPTRCATSALNRSRSRTLPFLPPDCKFFCQAAIRPPPPMSRATPVLHLVLGRIYQGETRPQRNRRHEHSYHRVPNPLPRVSNHALGNWNTG